MSGSVVTPQTSTTTSSASWHSSPDNEATAPEVLSSPPEEQRASPPEQSTSSTKTTSSLSTIQHQERIFLTGATRTGKSYLARALFLSTAAPRLVIDPADSSLTASAVGPEATFRDPSHPPPPDMPTARFVPRDPDDRDAYDAVYAWAFRNYPRYIWLDEAGQAAPAAGYPKALNRYVVQGAKRMLGHLGCHTRPREVARNLIAQASHVFIFDTPNPDDRRHLADLTGMDTPTLETALGQLNQYEFLWWNGVLRELTHCPALS